MGTNGVETVTVPGDDIRHQPFVARPVFAYHDGATGHRGVFEQRRFDFADLDAKAADLHLAVTATEEIEGSLRQAAYAVTRAVEPLVRRERIRDEFFGRELGPVAIPPCQSPATDEQLAFLGGPHLRIQDV